MISAPRDSASAIAIDDLPAPVGPQMTRTLLSSEAALELIPGDLHDRRPAVDVVCGERGGRQTDVQRLHFRERERVTTLDRRFARDGRGETLVARGRAGDAITRQRIERVAQASQRIEARVRHRYRRHDDG